MASDNYTKHDGIETPPPGRWTADEFIDAYEAVMQVATDDEEWAFNDGQRAAITHPDRPLRVTAGPGSGKSEVCIARVLMPIVVGGVDPRSIVLTTFTRKAAQNLEERLVNRIEALGLGDPVDASDVWVGTLHELCGEIMREFGYDDYMNVALLDEDAQRLFVRRESDFVDYLADGETEFFDPVISQTYSDGGCRKVHAADAATTLFNRIGQFCVDPEALARADEPELRHLAGAYDEYLTALSEGARCDFTRLQQWFLAFLESAAGDRFINGDGTRDIPPLKHVIVDEYQDVNPLQESVYFELLRRMPSSSLTVVGDDDQSLYRFRGATVDALIEFPERIADLIGVDQQEVSTVQLRTNYRSRPDIVEWTNRFIGCHPTMQTPGARADGKAPMVPARPDATQPSVTCLLGSSVTETANEFAEAVERLHDEGYIQDYSQVALLTHSTREQWTRWGRRTTSVGHYVQALRNREIPVYNPRNKAFLEHDEIQVILAAIIQCIDPGLEWADARINDSQLDPAINGWLTTFNSIVPQDGELRRLIDEISARVRGADQGDAFNFGLLELFYKLRACEPISSWTQGPDRDPARAKRIGKLTDLFESFESIAQGLTSARHLRRTTWDDWECVSTRFLGGFYWQFCEYLNAAELDEPEDTHDQLPADHVQVMTVHQAKGLEFPVVFVGSLDRTSTAGSAHWIEDTLGPFGVRQVRTRGDTRAERDLIRQFYVAHSRAEDSLILLGERADVSPEEVESVTAFGFHDDGTPMTMEWFQPDRVVTAAGDIADLTSTVGPRRIVGPKRRYSVVGDVLAFRRCMRQYGYRKVYNFEAAGATQLFAGLVVHRTLDWAHRHYQGDVEGVTGGRPPADEELREYFDEAVEALREQRILPMSPQAIDAIYEHIRRFNATVGPELYPRVKDTECTLRYDAPDYVLTGIADVIVDEEDGATEICDYKASARPDEGDDLLADFREQLEVYATLYREKEGELPDRGAIYFINEEDPEDTKLVVEFDDAPQSDVLARFEETVMEIERIRETDTWSDLSADDVPNTQTCGECDLRWDCPQQDYDDW